MLLRKGAVRGFWKDYVDSGTTYEVVNVVRQNTADIEAFRQAHVADIFAIEGWTQSNGFDNLYAQDSESNVIGYPTVPQHLLDVMKDHPNAVPATFDNPNFGHSFSGQKERIFAGEFSNEFTGDFL
jgi:hypothetical protein